MKSFLLENIGIKIVSLIIAVILWYYAIILENPYVERKFSLNVIVNNLSSDWIIDSITESVEVEVKGKRLDILNLFQVGKSWPVSANITLSEQITNVGNSPIKVTNNDPEKIQVLRIKPENASFKLFKQISREIPVDYQRVNKPAEGFSLSNISIDPKKVNVTGKKEQLDRIFSARIEPIDISGASENIPKLVKVKLYDKTGSEVSDVVVNPVRVLALVKIDPWPQKKVEVKPTILNEPDKGYELLGISIEPAQVTIRMEKENIEKFDAIYIPEPINLEELKESVTKEFKLHGKLFKNYNFVSEDSVKVFIKIGRKKSETIPRENKQE